MAQRARKLRIPFHASNPCISSGSLWSDQPRVRVALPPERKRRAIGRISTVIVIGKKPLPYAKRRGTEQTRPFHRFIIAERSAPEDARNEPAIDSARTEKRRADQRLIEGPKDASLQVTTVTSSRNRRRRVWKTNRRSGTLRRGRQQRETNRLDEMLGRCE